MAVPPLHLGSNFDSYISGEVIVHPSAVLAPGVILQAGPDGKIIIGLGVCVGMGTILQVDQGTLEIEAGVNLGAGFLMVGAGKIGKNACIGSATTVFHCSVEQGKIVVPGSILGDKSRVVTTSSATIEVVTTTQSATIGDSVLGLEMTPEKPFKINTSMEEKDHTKRVLIKKLETYNSQQLKESTDVEDYNNEYNCPPTVDETEIPKSQPNKYSTNEENLSHPAEDATTHIYGQGSIQQLLITLFPHRQSLNKPNSENNSD